MGDPARNWVIILVCLGVGPILAIHCWRATLRALRTGVIEGRFGPYSRYNAPIDFRINICLGFVASVMGMFFTLFGVVAAIALLVR